MSSGRSRRDDRKRGGGGGRGGRYRYVNYIPNAYEFQFICSCAGMYYVCLFIFIYLFGVRTFSNDKASETLNCGDIIGRAINSHSYYCVYVMF